MEVQPQLPKLLNGGLSTLIHTDGFGISPFLKWKQMRMKERLEWVGVRLNHWHTHTHI